SRTTAVAKWRAESPHRRRHPRAHAVRGDARTRWSAGTQVDVTAYLVADLGFGDAGKGTITDFLVRQHAAPLVVRYNGGAQAGHTVVTRDRAFTFAQFGSGTLVPGVRTHVSRFMVVHPT